MEFLNMKKNIELWLLTLIFTLEFYNISNVKTRNSRQYRNGDKKVSLFHNSLSETLFTELVMVIINKQTPIVIGA